MGRTVLVGRVRRAHGIRGEVMVDRYGDAPGILDPGSELALRRQEAVVTVTVEKVRPTPRGWIVAFQGLRDRNEAEALAGAELFVDENRLPELDEGTYYQFDLIGLEVVTTDGALWGKVEEIWEPGAHDLLVVRGERGEILIPAIEPFIREVDLKGRRILVEMPAGLEEAQRVPVAAAERDVRSTEIGDAGEGIEKARAVGRAAKRGTRPRARSLDPRPGGDEIE